MDKGRLELGKGTNEINLTLGSEVFQSTSFVTLGAQWLVACGSGADPSGQTGRKQLKNLLYRCDQI